MSHQSRARLLPSPFVMLLLLALGAAVIWLQATDGLGDRGMNNPFSYIAVMLAAVIYGLWFLLFSGQSGRCKLLSLVAVAGVMGLVFLLVRMDGYTGSMVPQWHWAWESRADAELAGDSVLADATSQIDLLAANPANFPGFQGPRRNGEVLGVRLTGWEANPPELLWKQPVGFGWSGFAVVNGVAVTHEQRNGQQLVIARDLATGTTLWRHATEEEITHPMGGKGPRSTPLIHGGLVYAQDSGGRLLCLDGATGALVWEHDLPAEFGMTDELEQTLIQYGRSASPLAVDDLLVMPAGGDPEGRRAGLVAFDLKSGTVRWEGPPRNISHASPVLATVAGQRQILVMNEDSVSGHLPDSGALLWEHPWPGSTAADANNSSPLPVGDDGVLISKGYGKGSKLLRISAAVDGVQQATVQWASRRSLRTKLTNAVVRGEHAYALSDGILECTSLANGKRVWRDGRYGHGQLLLVGEKLLILSEEGQLVLVAASPDQEHLVLGTLDALEGVTWNTFALYGDVVVLRNGTNAGAWRLPTAG